MKGANARNLEITNFAIKLPVITDKRELCRIIDMNYYLYQFKRFVNRVSFRLFGYSFCRLYHPHKTIFRPHSHYQNITDLTQNLTSICYIYQEYMWDLSNFTPIMEVLRTHLEPILDSRITYSNLVLQKIIHSQPNAVMVHIRRGDFKNTNYTLLDMDYYNEAFRILRERLSDSRFFIFGNDVAFMREHFRTQDCYIVDINGEDSVSLDFVLMRQCRHAILANSSLSAWIGIFAKGIVVYKKDCYPKPPQFSGENFIGI